MRPWALSASPPENKNSPWILFEAGALTKGLTANRVCTLLIDLKPADVENPLAQFNHTSVEQKSMFSLVATVNRSLPEGLRLDEVTLQTVFSQNYPDFAQRFERALKDHPTNFTTPTRPANELLNEILETTRSLNHRMSRLEQANLPPLPPWLSPERASAMSDQYRESALIGEAAALEDAMNNPFPFVERPGRSPRTRRVRARSSDNKDGDGAASS